MCVNRVIDARQKGVARELAKKIESLPKREQDERYRLLYSNIIALLLLYSLEFRYFGLQIANSKCVAYTYCIFLIS